jgi:hypothetical protein
MHRLQSVLARAVAVSVLVGLAAPLPVLGGLAAAADADAQQSRQRTRPAQRPQIILRDRWLHGPPPPPSSDRNYYGPAPGIQQPMERVPLPAPLSPPPTNR